MQNAYADILLSGAFAAFTVDVLLYPLDTVKTRLQSRDYARLFKNNRPALFRGMYQGVGSVIVATLPSSGAFFVSYEAIKAAAEHQSVIPPPVVHFAASSVSELVECAIFAPAETIKQNAQMVTSAAQSPKAKASATWQTLKRFRQSPMALWSGYTALVVRDLPFTAIHFPLYERFKEQLFRRRPPQTLTETALLTSVASGVAGGVAAVLTTPVDVIKTRIMLDAGTASTSASAVKADALGNVVSAVPQTSGWISNAKEILAKDGLPGLWRGGALRTVWTVLGSGMYLAVYECGRIYLAQRRGAHLPDDELFQG